MSQFTLEEEKRIQLQKRQQNRMYKTWKIFNIIFWGDSDKVRYFCLLHFNEHLLP